MYYIYVTSGPSLLIESTDSMMHLFLACVQDFKSFDRKIRRLYSEQMGPLYAASLEQGSYQRGYDYIVRLVRKSTTS